MHHFSLRGIIRPAALILLLLSAFSAQAVLKERDLAKTLDVLCAELEHNYSEQQRSMQIYRQRTTDQHKQLVQTMQQIDQISLILYSQRKDFTFDMAYACQEATHLFRYSGLAHRPYNRIIAYLNEEVERYDSLIVVLRNIAPVVTDADTLPKQMANHLSDSILNARAALAAAHTLNDSATAGMTISAVDSIVNQMDEANREQTRNLFMLNEQQQKLRARCLFFATEIRNNLLEIVDGVSDDRHFYGLVSQRLENINSYANKRYDELRSSIFDNGGENYFQTLSKLPMTIRRSKMDINDKYTTLPRSGSNVPIKSDWRGPVIMGVSVFILFYIFVASVLSGVLMRWFIPSKIRRSSVFRGKKNIIGLSCGVLLFTLAITAARSFADNNFIDMAIGVAINFSWLVQVILLSLVIRLSNERLRAGVKAYTPFMLMAFIVIVFRIVFIPNNVVKLIYPPLLLLFTLWQLRVIRGRKAGLLPEGDMIYSSISLSAMIISCGLAWLGYTLLAVQIMVWWSFQLASIQTIICLYDIVKMYKQRTLVKRLTDESAATLTPHRTEELLKKAEKGDFITKTWLIDMINMAILPLMAVLSVLMSIRFAANMFNMGDAIERMFFFNFIDKNGLAQISLNKVVMVGGLFFEFRYLNYLLHSFYHYYHSRRRKNNPNYNANLTLANNVISIAVWGIYFIFALIVFQVPKSGISLITAGLATGLGFAMKDILENFIYGLSLMSGRVRVGDYIECDGILGKVDSITYQSTQIITLDGAVIAFLNTSLFNKNFKNLTRNHSYEYVKVPVGVAYGVKVEQVRDVVIPALERIVTEKDGRPVVRREQGFKVVFNDFGDSAIELLVTFWVLVEERISFVCSAKETIYNALQANGIEIPFPQQDVYVRQLPDRH